MPVANLDPIVKEFTDTRRPRYFILYMAVANKPNLEKYTTLPEVKDRFGGEK